MLDKVSGFLIFLSVLVIIYILVELLLFFVNSGATSKIKTSSPTFDFDQSVKTIMSSQLFGTDQGVSAPDLQDIPDQTRLHLELMGIIAGGNRSSAIIRVRGNRTNIYRAGDQIIDGVLLSAIQDGYVLLEKSGIFERLDFPMSTNIASAVTQTAQVPEPAQGIANGHAQNDQFLTLIERLHVDTSGLYKPDNTKGQPGYWLGLQPGDQILSINGQPFSGLLGNPIALATVVSSGRIRLNVRRGAENIVVTAVLP